MSFNRNIPYNELTALPPTAYVESAAVLKQVALASRHLGELNGLLVSLPDPQLLINTVVLQESKDSTAIENIVTTQDELYLSVTDEQVENSAAKEVLRYREALYKGWNHLKNHENLLLTNGMIEMVQTIKQNHAGLRTMPGTALKNAVTNEIMYTPPCCEDIIREKLRDLERFINDDSMFDADPLIKMAMIHYQFEAIHPFADGNGRTGRILNGLYLVQKGLLSYPVLYLSSYIMNHKSLYYQLLRGVTETENWNDWILYMLTAIAETSQLTARKIKALLALKNQIENEMKQILGASFTHDLLQLSFALPYLKIELIEQKGLAHRQTASVWLKKLADAQILFPRKVGRTTYFVNKRLIHLLSED
jgi:Fic family protein